ncbi:hypothetical protein ACFQE5_17855 [Pseudonocardia hispaniensis]|uniref:Winged helix-turn helix protein n=1 Tax=Pseudonocardia hispaniensis TaxID=904933 RepID=A0ABW1J5G6_9PSEU
MTEQGRAVSNATARRRAALLASDQPSPILGRHASRSEIAAETPIFHALTAGGWRSRQHEPAAAPVPPAPRARPVDPMVAFRRDPLTAPIPVQALIPPREAATRHRGCATGGAHALPEPSGRHHRSTRVRTGIDGRW